MSAQRRVALITGSGTGIGAATAELLARNRYDLIISYNRNARSTENTADACRAAGADVLVLRCDVSQENDVLEMSRKVEAKFGHLDVVCNNAGTSIDKLAKDFDRVSVEEFDHVMAVNVRGLFLVAKHTKPLLLRGTDPCMVNTASIVGLRPGPQPLPYVASKAAVVAMTQALCLALGPGVRVNAVAPGWMEGDWMRWMLGEDYERLMARRAKMTPLKRCVKPQDVADVVLALIETMKFVSGETIVIDGGFAKTT